MKSNGLEIYLTRSGHELGSENFLALCTFP